MAGHDTVAPVEQKVFTLQSLPPVEEPKEGSSRVANVAGLLRASCPPPFGPAFGCSKSLPAIFSAYMPGSWQKRINGTNSNDCAVTLPGRRYQSNAYHSFKVIACIEDPVVID